VQLLNASLWGHKTIGEDLIKTVSVTCTEGTK
jgi:hypothetical protein